MMNSIKVLPEHIEPVYPRIVELHFLLFNRNNPKPAKCKIVVYVVYSAECTDCAKLDVWTQITKFDWIQNVIQSRHKSNIDYS